MASVKKNVFSKKPLVRGKLNFSSLDQIYEQVIRGAEKKMRSLLIMVYGTASLKNLDVQMLLNCHLVDHMPRPIGQRYTPSGPEDDHPFRVLQTQKQIGDEPHMGGARIFEQGDGSDPSTLCVR